MFSLPFPPSVIMLGSRTTSMTLPFCPCATTRHCRLIDKAPPGRPTSFADLRPDSCRRAPTVPSKSRLFQRDDDPTSKEPCIALFPKIQNTHAVGLSAVISNRCWVLCARRAILPTYLHWTHDSLSPPGPQQLLKKLVICIIFVLFLLCERKVFLQSEDRLGEVSSINFTKPEGAWL